MKNIYIIILCCIAGALQAQPRQDPGERREKVEAMKIAYITGELDLTTDEAKQFWPVYNKYTDELQKIRTDRRERLRDARSEFSGMSDAEVEKVIDNEIASRQTELDVLKKYHQQFKTVLPMKKVARLYRAEEGFKRELLDRIKDRNDGKPPGKR